MTKTIVLANERQTLQLGAILARILRAGQTLFLSGVIGAGKTTVVRGFLRQLNYSDKVKSPSYTLVESYELGNIRICHFDLYRLNDPEELEMIGVRDYFDGQTIAIVEWPEKGCLALPAPDICCQLEVVAHHRQAELSLVNPSLTAEALDIMIGAETALEKILAVPDDKHRA